MDMRLPNWVRLIVLVSILMKMMFGITLLIDPSRIAEMWPWPLPPLTARMLGASTLVSVPLALLSIGVNRFGAAMIPFVMMLTYRVLQIAAGLAHAGKFELASLTTLNYFGGGGMMAAIFAWVLWAGHNKRLPAATAKAPLAKRMAWAPNDTFRWALRALAAIYVILGLAFFLLGKDAASFWIDARGMTPLTARLFASPLVGLGLGLFLVSRARDWRAVMTPAAGFVTIGVACTLAMALEAGDLAPQSAVGWLVAATPLILLAAGAVIFATKPKA